MGGFMSANVTAPMPQQHASPAVAGAVWHSLVWLVLGNAMGVMIAILLLLPGLNPWLGEWTYGRWMMVHMNTALYGWCSLPMLGFLFKVYGADRGGLSIWCRPVLWLWSGALVVGSISWLSGQSSGKLFLDWSGFARLFFPLSMASLWLLLTIVFVSKLRQDPQPRRAALLAKVLGLIILAAVPFAIYFASSLTVYPAVNPDTGGPTGASQLESSLGVVLILLVLPFGITRRKEGRANAVWLSWIIFFAETALIFVLGGMDISHHRPAQYLGLASLLIWLPLVPAYYAAFQWHAATRGWRIAMFWWWGGLVVSGWVLFLPGILDRIKFTDVLVGHSLTAVAGFLTALLIFVMIQLIGEEDAWIFNRTWSFHAWNLGVLAYVIIISIAGWIESANPAFTIVPGPARQVLYFVRLLTGIAMLLGSAEWLIAASSLPALAWQAKGELQGVNVA
jgi:cytochrome c oxidase cbb3-type subunit 1